MNCLFCNITQGNIPVDIIYEDQNLMAFRDINAQAPTHVLIVPKKHISTINDMSEQDTPLIGNMIMTAKTVAAQEGLSNDGYRLVFNVNSNGGQTVFHIHLHILGGRQMTWPPG